MADILDLVSPTTAELLKWWFQAEYCAMRGFNFHEGQRQAILNVIYAHEVLGVTSLRALYEQVAADELLEGGRLLEVDQAKHRHPKYCLKMATGTGKTWVLQALLVWQLLNKLAESGDRRFTKNFLLVAPGLIVYDRLLDAFCGKLKDGVRDFATSDIMQYAELFIPESHRETVFRFVQSNVCDKENIGSNPMLAEGQRVMLRAGLSKLKKLEADFAKIAPHRYPKMMVICEDTSVSPEVVKFLVGEGLSADEVMAIDSGRKGELKTDEWEKVRERLFDVDRHKAPRVLVSVLMLREGFDVSNICVIVPLRTTGAQILLEQTIGRGLRLMWRDHEYADIKQENRERIRNGHEPQSLIDILSVIEHPAFQSFYDELMKEGLAGTTSDEQDGTSSIGDLISVGLVEGYKEYDFAIPFILSEDDEELSVLNIDTEKITGFSTYTQQQLKAMLGKGDVFASHDVQSGTRFGDYRVQGGVMTAAGYNEYLSRMTARLSQVLNQPLTGKSGGVAKFPYLQIHTVELVKALDAYIRSKLFGEPFDPLIDENWRLLLLDPLLQHIIRVFAEAILTAEESEQISGFEVAHRWLSEVEKLPMRDSFSIPTRKCIYERQPFPSHNGGLEKAFMEWAQKDSAVQAFCKINETKHSFCRLRYLKDDGLPAMYSPDFLVKAETEIFLVETKAQKDVRAPNVQRKLKSAAAWCERINTLTDDDRMGREWHYVLLGEAQFYEWRDKAASMVELLKFAQVRMSAVPIQKRLGL